MIQYPTGTWKTKWVMCAVIACAFWVPSVLMPFDIQVRSERPRIWIRNSEWNGPSVQKIREWMTLPEYKKRVRGIHEEAIGTALHYMVTGDRASGRKAVDALKKMSKSIEEGRIRRQCIAAMYDWLHDHPDFDDASRKAVLEYLEKRCKKDVATLSEAGNPCYTIVTRKLAALTCAALAIHGDCPDANKYIAFAADRLKKLGTIREKEDGASGGASYSYRHMYGDQARTVAAWRSATDWDAAQWIRTHQGDWLRRQVDFQIWMTYPNGWFVKEGDIWAGSHRDRGQWRGQVDMVTGMYNYGIGRTWADSMAKRWNLKDYRHHIWEFFLFNNPDIEPEPLEDLGRTDVFSPDLHGYVCWRESWDPGATIIHFRCGETIYHHATMDQGKFLIFRHRPLAVKNGGYIGYKSKHHWYYKSPWSTNCVLFTGEKHDGMQPFVRLHGKDWKECWGERNRKADRPMAGVLLKTEANNAYAMARGDLSGSIPQGTGSVWFREFVFLGYKYLVVLDRVKAGGGLLHRWALHTVHEPDIKGRTGIADYPPGRLIWKTLLPEKARIVKVGGKGHEFDFNGENRPPKNWKGNIGDYKPEMQMGAWRIDVAPEDGRKECMYLHVLYAADADAEKNFTCSCTEKNGSVTVRVEDLEYTFEYSGKK